jgi:hypothetical protein
VIFDDEAQVRGCKASADYALSAHGFKRVQTILPDTNLFIISFSLDIVGRFERESMKIVGACSDPR